jgi:hypothetical protein
VALCCTLREGPPEDPRSQPGEDFDFSFVHL